mmetsp:Transcript_105092/g.304027  ORF Transcript_105092/g.304027 Transcript_105092/m.304027 type:complete len:91 (+) Transcript_105092:435-707(+)
MSIIPIAAFASMQCFLSDIDFHCLRDRIIFRVTVIIVGFRRLFCSIMHICLGRRECNSFDRRTKYLVLVGKVKKIISSIDSSNGFGRLFT